MIGDYKTPRIREVVLPVKEGIGWVPEVKEEDFLCGCDHALEHILRAGFDPGDQTWEPRVG